MNCSELLYQQVAKVGRTPLPLTLLAIDVAPGKALWFALDFPETVFSEVPVTALTLQMVPDTKFSVGGFGRGHLHHSSLQPSEPVPLETVFYFRLILASFRKGPLSLFSPPVPCPHFPLSTFFSSFPSFVIYFYFSTPISTLFYFISYMYICVWESVHMRAVAHGGQQRASDHLELDLQAVVGGWVLNLVPCRNSKLYSLLLTEPSLQPLIFSKSSFSPNPHHLLH